MFESAKTVRGDDDRSVVQDDASFSTLGASEVATESKQVSVQPVVAAQYSVASAAPTHFSDIGACWHGITVGGGALEDSHAQDLPDVDKLAVIEQHFLPDKNFGLPVKLTANSASSNLLEEFPPPPPPLPP